MLSYIVSTTVKLKGLRQTAQANRSDQDQTALDKREYLMIIFLISH